MDRTHEQWQRELEADLSRWERGEHDVEGLLAPREQFLDPTPLPPTHQVDRGGGRSGGLGSARRRTLNGRSRGYLTVLATLLALTTFFLVDPGGSGTSIRRALGLDQRLLGQVDPGDATSYEFLGTRGRSDEPVTWNPCEPIRYLVNPEQAPDRWRELIDSAVAEVTAASGLSLEYEGTSTERTFAQRDSLNSADPVLIGFADADEVPRLGGDVAGLGGPVQRTIGNTSTFVSGSIVLDSQLFDKLDTAPGGRNQQRAIVMHEIGHLVGLAHVDDPTQLMNASNVGRTDFGAGDLAGLARLGSGPC